MEFDGTDVGYHIRLGCFKFQRQCFNNDDFAHFVINFTQCDSFPIQDIALECLARTLDQPFVTIQLLSKRPLFVALSQFT